MLNACRAAIIDRSVILIWSNRSKWLAFLLVTAAYGISFGELWQRYIIYQMSNWPHSVTNAVFLVGMCVPMLILGGVSVAYYDKSRKERGPANKTQQGAYLSLWRGDQTLAGAFWQFFPLSTFLVIAGGQKLTFVMTNATSNAQTVMGMLEFAVCLGFHIVVTTGTWRSANRYAGHRMWALLAKTSVLLSFVVLACTLIFGVLGFNIFAHSVRT